MINCEMTAHVDQRERRKQHKRLAMRLVSRFQAGGGAAVMDSGFVRWTSDPEGIIPANGADASRSLRSSAATGTPAGRRLHATTADEAQPAAAGSEMFISMAVSSSVVKLWGRRHSLPDLGCQSQRSTISNPCRSKRPAAASGTHLVIASSPP